MDGPDAATARPAHPLHQKFYSEFQSKILADQINHVHIRSTCFISTGAAVPKRVHVPWPSG